MQDFNPWMSDNDIYSKLVNIRTVKFEPRLCVTTHANNSLELAFEA